MVLRARADQCAETGRPKEAIEAYSRILTMLDGSASFRPKSDLRHANELSRVLTSLAVQYRAVGETSKGGQLEERRHQLWRNHDRRVPNNAFIRRRLAATEKP